jgi:ABC-type amino acid transport substrate-binding protein
MKKIVNVLIFIFVMYSSALFAAEKKVIIGVPDEWSNSLRSLKELLKESYNDVGYEISFIELPLARSMVELNNGKIDGELINSKSVAQEYNLIIVTPPYFTLKTYAYYLKRKFKKNPTIDEIKKGRIGYLRGSFVIEKFFSDAKSPLTVNNEKQLLSLLKKDRVDFVTSMNASFAIKESNFGKVLLFEISMHHILSKKNAELAKKLEPVLKKNMAKKKYDHLYEQIQKLILKKPE